MSKKKQHKYKSADEKRKALEAEALQKDMDKRWNITYSNSKKKPISSKEYVMNITYRGSDQKLPSLITNQGGKCSKPKQHIYSGTLIKGIATMHKSNAVPVIDEQQMIDISRMRRG